MGRFMTPDWAAKAVAVPYAELGDPQSLNLYSYVRNNPIRFTDPAGHEAKPQCSGDTCTTTESKTVVSGYYVTKDGGAIVKTTTITTVTETTTNADGSKESNVTSQTETTRLFNFNSVGDITGVTEHNFTTTSIQRSRKRLAENTAVNRLSLLLTPPLAICLHFRIRSHKPMDSGRMSGKCSLGSR